MLVGAFASTAGAAPANGPQVVTPIEIAAAGHGPSVSGDGSRLVFVAAEDVTGLDRVWLSDRSNGELTQLTFAGEGVRDGNSRNPVISRDGCSVVIVTELAFDLFRDDDIDQRWDIYRLGLPGCVDSSDDEQWELVSTTSLSEPAARNDVAADQAPAINASGEIIVYARRALATAGTSAMWTSLDAVDLTVLLGEPGRTVPIPGLPDFLPTSANTYVGQRDPAISDNGQVISFTTDAEIEVELADLEDVEAVDTISATWAGGLDPSGPATTQVYIWERELGADDESVPMRLVSARRTGEPGSGSSGQSTISALGDVLAFTSAAPDLLDGEVVGTQVYRVEFEPELAISLISGVDGLPGDGDSTQPAIDASGALVTFVSQAMNLTEIAPARRGSGGDVLLADTGIGTIERLTMRPDGLPATPSANAPDVSASGRVVVFSTWSAAELATDSDQQLLDDSQIAVIDRPPVLSISNIDVGTVEVGLESTEWRTTLQNLGPSSFVPGEMWTPETGMRLTGGTCVVLVPVAPGDSCTIHFAVTPQGAGPFGGSINVRERGGPLTATAIVTGSGGIPSIVTAPAGVVLDASMVGATSDPTIVSIINTGAFPEVINRLIRGGSHPDDLDILFDACTGRGLEPGDVCEVAVTITPGADGPRNTILTAITAAGATASTVIDGRGIYTPLVALDAEVISQRRQVEVVGMGFPANAVVTVGWTNDDRPKQVAVDANGVLITRLVPAPGMSGPQTVTVIDPSLRFDPVTTRKVLITVEQNRRRSLED